ncbi:MULTISPECIES: AAA family ATPase [Clostridia]|uniref:AAA family ATPase n=1 Tax=Clostridia TaxID=186801 RepID=UPI00067EBB37|nr:MULTISPECIES: AAA family ATPase [Clostridia]
MYIIVISGLPGSGKSHLAEYIAEKLNLPMICKDSIKEILFDTIGFRNREEKTKLNEASLQIMFSISKELLKTNQNLILENNFENNAYPFFEELKTKFDVQLLTVLIYGDTKVLYDRYALRNKDPNRHRGHILFTEYPERVKTNYIPEPITYETYYRDFKERGMSDFCVGENTIRVDVTDFSRINYDNIVEEIYCIVNQNI